MEALGVYRAINAVQSALAKTGISKDRRNSQQGYNFRGIDDVYAAISPLLAEHG
ncbi:MAG: ERF family protein, partial [Casimicrobium sp.]